MAPGARIPAHHPEEDADILYLTQGSISYGGKTWKGGTSQDVGTYMFIQNGAEVKDIATDTGATAFFIALPMLADIEATRACDRRRQEKARRRRVRVDKNTWPSCAE